MWLARVCQFGLATASHVPAKSFREVRVLTRYRRTLISQRSRVRNRVHKILDRSGVRVGGVLSDVFGRNGRRILDGLAQGPPTPSSPRSAITWRTRMPRRCAAPGVERGRTPVGNK